MIRAVFFDIDGTLVSFQTHRIAESTLLALQELREKGVLLFIASGRAPDGLAVLDVFPFDGYVLMNGQLCLDGEGRIISESTMEAEDIRALTAYEREQHFPLCFFTPDRKTFNFRNEDVERIHGETQNVPHPVGDLSHIDQEKVYQVMAFVDEKQERELNDLLPSAICSRWHPLCCDIMPKNGTKLKGIQRMLEYYGISQAETMAFGDGGNDLQMIEFAGLSVAMGNASETLKAAANYVTDDADHDGIAKAFAEFGMIGSAVQRS